MSISQIIKAVFQKDSTRQVHTANQEMVELAETTSDPAEQLRLAYHPDDAVKFALAGNPNLSTEGAQVALLHSVDADIREALILNPALNADLLAQHLIQMAQPGSEDATRDFEATIQRQLTVPDGSEPQVEAELEKYLGVE